MKFFATVGTAAAAVVVTMSGASPAAASSPHPETMTSVRPAATTGSDMLDCYFSTVYRACSSFTVSGSTGYYQVCDEYDDNPQRYARGRLSINGVVRAHGHVTGAGLCAYVANIPMGHGDRVCIHTGSEGLGWTVPECRTF